MSRALAPEGLFLRAPSPPRPRLDFLQPMARARIQIKLVKSLQLLNPFQRCWTEWSLAVEGMQHNALQQIAKGHVVVLGKSLEHFEKPLLHAHPGLHPFDQQFRIVDHVYQCTTVHRYLQDNFTRSALRTRVQAAGWL